MRTLTKLIAALSGLLLASMYKQVHCIDKNRETIRSISTKFPEVITAAMEITN